MRPIRAPLLIFACLGLLASQLSGLHMHVDAHGYVGKLEGTHVHGTAVQARDRALADHADDMGHDHHIGDQDHEGDRDVSVVELGAGTAKILIFFAWLGLGLVIVLRRAGSVRIGAVVPRPKTRRDRWRPLLRAPPLSSPIR